MLAETHDLVDCDDPTGPRDTSQWDYRIMTGIAVIVIGGVALVIWGKYDYCRGWADHYATQAEKLRRDACDPQYTEEQQVEFRLVAEWDEQISKKYALVAREPWRPYPKAPLITPEDKQLAQARVAADEQ